MKRFIHYVRMLFLGLVAGMLLAPVSGTAEEQHADCAYTLGTFQQSNIIETYKAWFPVAEVIRKTTGCTVKIIVSQTIRNFDKTGEVYDFVYANPLQVLKWNKRHGYVPLLHNKKKFKANLLVKKDSPIKELNELDGTGMAVPGIGTIGSVIIVADLAKKYGITLKLKEVHSHGSVYLTVLKGLMKSGASANSIFEAYKPEYKNGLRVIYETQELTPLTLAMTPKIDEDKRDAIQKALLENPDALSAVPFVDPVAASLSEYESMAEYLEIK